MSQITFHLAILLIISIATSARARDSANRFDPKSQSATAGSVLDLKADTKFPTVRTVTIGAGKSLLVKLPVAIRDLVVSEPDQVDAIVQSNNRVFMIAKKTGQTNAFFFDQYGEQVLTLEIVVGADLNALSELFKDLLPGSNIKIKTAGKALVLTGSVRSPIDARRASEIATHFAKAAGGAVAVASSQPGKNTNGADLNLTQGTGGKDSQQTDDKMVVNLLSVDAEEQVLLRVTVAEVNRTLLKQLGINLGATLSGGGFSTSILSDNALPLTSAAGLSKLATTTLGSDGKLSFSGNSGVSTTYSSGGQQIAATIKALERDGLIRTLAEPNLTAVSGESAKFLAGGEYPVPVVDSSGQTSVTFKEFGVGVAFTPVVMSEGRISLKIDVEVSELSNEGAVTLSNIAISAIKKRQSKTTVELPSGGTLAIAGLISDTTKQNLDGTPGIKDIPILGTLFRSRDFTKSETELVVIVTPVLVKPAARQNLSLPQDGLAEASDLRANLLGHLNRVYGKGAPLPPGDLKGDYGFIVD